MATDFSDLLYEAEKLTHDIEGTIELPKVDRSLRQVLEASNELYTRVAQAGAKDIQANLLLGSKGIDLPRISQKLDAISAQRTLEPIEPADDVDLDVCLENEVRNTIFGTIEREHKSTYEAILCNTREHELGEWKQEKRKILNAMIGPSGSFITPTKQSSLFIDQPHVETMYMNQQEAIYASKVMEMNRRIARGEPKPNYVEFFANAAAEFKDTKVNDMWDIIRYMTNIPPVCSIDDRISVRKNAVVITAMVNQGKKYLENRYTTYMSNVINENLMLAQRGGIPGTFPLVKGYLGIRLQGSYIGLTDGEVEERPLWPMVYYCLRCGDLSAALDCLKRSNTTQRFPELVTILEAKYRNPKHPDIHKLETSVRFQYRRTIRNETDPFKRIVWAVMGCCDIADDHSEVARTADDWLWLKLSLVRADYENKEDCIDYFDLQNTIIEEYGESHYDAAHQPHLYFQVLALTGQFEAAIEFLSRIDRFRVHAVHMAISLHELYILAGSADYSSPLIFIDPVDPKPSRRLNIVRLLMVYVRKFEMHCIQEALHYFYIMHNMENSLKENMFVLAVSDLVQETREFERMFGKMMRNGIRTEGMLDQFKHNDITVETIAKRVAEILQQKGEFDDAINMFDIARDQTNALNLVSMLLSQLVSKIGQPGSQRDRVGFKVKELYDRYSSEGFRCPLTVSSTFCNLKDLLMFFDHYHNKNFPAAMRVLEELKLIPLQMIELEARLNHFKTLTAEVSRVMPEVLLATMNMYYAQYQKLKENEFVPLNRMHDFGIDKQLSNIQEQAKLLTNFTGMLPYRMPGDTNSRLVQMEILMH